LLIYRTIVKEKREKPEIGVPRKSALLYYRPDESLKEIVLGLLSLVADCWLLIIVTQTQQPSTAH
jgi:hypothetical protein